MRNSSTKHELQSKFAVTINGILTSRENTGDIAISWSEFDTLQTLAYRIGGRFSVTNENGRFVSCYWICNNQFMCEPDDWDPSCINCHKVCFLVATQDVIVQPE